MSFHLYRNSTKHVPVVLASQRCGKRWCSFLSYSASKFAERAINHSQHSNNLERIRQDKPENLMKTSEMDNYLNQEREKKEKKENNSISFDECHTSDEIMKRLWNAPVVLDDTVYQNAMKRCNYLGDYKTALRIFSIMDKNDIERDIHSYNILIECLCHCDRTELAYKYLDEITVKPDFSTFSLILSSCKNRRNLVEIAEKIWKCMIFEHEIMPNGELCNIMISIYARCGDVHKAEIIWNHLTAQNIVDSESCAQMIYCYSIKKDEFKMNQIENYMNSNNIQMSSDHYYGIIKYYLSSGQLNRVLSLFNKMNYNLISMNDKLLYQLMTTHLQLSNYDIILQQIVQKYPKLFQQHHELNGLLFEAMILKQKHEKHEYSDTELIETFQRMINESHLTGYWTKYKMNKAMDKYTYLIDLHGIFRRKRMIRFVLRYIFQFEKYFIQNQLNKNEDVVILCGKGVHSDPGFVGTTKTMAENELLSWDPPIRTKPYKQYNSCLVLNSDDIKNFFDVQDCKPPFFNCPQRE